MSPGPGQPEPSPDELPQVTSDHSEAIVVDGGDQAATDISSEDDFFSLRALGSIDISSQEFLDKKTKFFSDLAIHERGALHFHRTEGLWQRTENGEREWGNVTEHCLVEVARVQAFAKALGLDTKLTDDLMTAAALHDYFKKGEKAILERKGLTWEAYAEAQEIVHDNLLSAGFGARIVALAGSVGHETLLEVEKILYKDELSPDEIAYLVMHYVDDYTVNSEWAQPAEVTDDSAINDLDRRMDKNEANPRYSVINEAGKEHFHGETAYAAQRRVGHLVEERLAQIIVSRTGQSIDPIDLPIFIDNLVKQKIAEI